MAKLSPLNANSRLFESLTDGQGNPITQGVVSHELISYLNQFQNISPDETIYPEDFGAKGDGSTDDTVAIQAAIDSASDLNGATIKLGPKTYKTTATITIAQDRINIVGSGEQATRIMFTPTADDVAMEWDKGGTMISQCTIRDLALYTTDTTYAKVGMRLEDIDIFEMKNVQISGSDTDGWTGGTESIGLQIQGRNIGSIQNVNIKADVPISIEDNPNHTIDIDHFNFHNIYLISKSDDSFPCVRIADGVNLHNVSFDGVQAWAFGSYGFYWADTTTTITSNNLSFKNVRWEQSTSGNHAFYISHNTALQNLSFEHVHSGSTTDNKGYYLRKCRFVYFNSVLYGGTIEAFNADNTCHLIAFNNVLFQDNSTASTTGLTQVWGDSPWSTLGPIPNNCFYDVTDNTTKKNNYIFGVRHWKGTGDVANGAVVNLPISGADDPLAYISLIGYSSVGPIEEGGQAFQTPSSMVSIAGTANFAVTDVGGDLCLIRQAAAATQIKNNTGQTITYVIQIEWME